MVLENVPASQLNTEFTLKKGTYSNKKIQLELLSNDLNNINLVDYSSEFEIVDSPEIVSTSPSGILCLGDPLQLSISSKGSDISCQWFKDEDIINGANLSYLNFESVNHQTSGVYKCRVSNNNSNVCESVYSEEIVIYVNTNAEIIDQPVSQKAFTGGSVTFEFDTHFNGKTETNIGPRIQWFKGDLPLRNSERISGVNSNYLKLNDLKESDFSMEDDYYAKVFDDCNEVSTKKVRLEKVEIEVIKQPESKTICRNDDYDFSFMIDDKNFEIEYQWFKNGQEIHDNELISGSNSNYLNVKVTDKEMGGEYYCKAKINNGKTEINSKIALLIVEEEPLILEDIPDNIKIKQNDHLHLTLSVHSNSSLYYQWYKDQEKIIGENKFELTKMLSSEDDSGEYYCIISNDCGSIISKVTKVEVEAENNLSVAFTQEGKYIIGNPSPNPANQYFKIEFSIPISKNVTIKLISQTGEEIILTKEKVFPKGVNQLFINIKELELSVGSYLIIFNFDKVILSDRIIVL